MHIHHFKIFSTEEILAEGRYKMLYCDARCQCGKLKGRYFLPTS